MFFHALLGGVYSFTYFYLIYIRLATNTVKIQVSFWPDINFPSPAMFHLLGTATLLSTSVVYHVKNGLWMEL